jgi:segregation and condensation protein B
VRILGRKKVVGNPLLYGTSREFLIHFGLNSLEDLPSIEEFDQFLGALDAARAAEAPPEGESASEPADELELAALEAARAQAADQAATDLELAELDPELELLTAEHEDREDA